MVVTRITNGLGNQLFQYAMGRRLAAKHKVSLKLDLDWFRVPEDVPGLAMFGRNYQLQAFNIIAEAASPADRERFATPGLRPLDPRRVYGIKRRLFRRYVPQMCKMRVDECSSNFEARLLRLPGDVYLNGWWQSEKYFLDHGDLIRRDLYLRDTTITEQACSLVNGRRNGHRPLVSIQVRRGDVARAHEVLRDLTHMPYELVSREYLHSAMSVFGDDATFLVFSDTAEDIEWCRANLRARDIHFVRGMSDLNDFSTMRQCDHHIISNSSFGWWAAWLNPNPNKIVVAPQRWFRRQYAPHYDIRSIVPESWLIR